MCFALTFLYVFNMARQRCFFKVLLLNELSLLLSDWLAFSGNGSRWLVTCRTLKNNLINQNNRYGTYKKILQCAIAIQQNMSFMHLSRPACQRVSKGVNVSTCNDTTRKLDHNKRHVAFVSTWTTTFTGKHIVASTRQHSDKRTRA